VPQVQPQYPQQGPQIQPYSSPMQTPPQPSAWPANVYQGAYQSPHRGPPVNNGASIPYPYGQLPSTANPADPKSQHPIPGSFNRHAFNPKTQSFVPGTANGPQQPMPHHPSSHLPHNMYGPPQPQYPMGYNMARQPSNTSLPSYHASPHMPVRQMMPHNMGPQAQATHHLPPYNSSLPPKPPPTA
jgi:hypothetical protein